MLYIYLYAKVLNHIRLSYIPRWHGHDDPRTPTQFPRAHTSRASTPGRGVKYCFFRGARRTGHTSGRIFSATKYPYARFMFSLKVTSNAHMYSSTIQYFYFFRLSKSGNRWSQTVRPEPAKDKMYLITVGLMRRRWGDWIFVRPNMRWIFFFLEKDPGGFQNFTLILVILT